MPKTYRKGLSKKTVYKAKKVLAKREKRRAVQGKDTKFVRCEQQFTITPTNVGGAPANGLNWIFNNFQMLTSAASQVMSIENSVDFAINRTLYDKVRINRMRVKLVPRANVLDYATAQNDTSYNVSGTQSLYSAIDANSPLPWGASNSETISLFEQLPSMKKTSVLKNLVRQIAVCYAPNLWLDTVNLFSNLTLLRDIGLFQNIGIFATNLLTDKSETAFEPVYDCIVSWDCVFSSAKPKSTKVNLDGTVTISTYKAPAVLPESILEPYSIVPKEVPPV